MTSPPSPSAPAADTSAIDRARTASEVLLLEALDIAARRNWAAYADIMVRERAFQYLAVLQAWRASSVAVPMPESCESTATTDRADNEADDRRPLAERFRLAIASGSSLINIDSSAPQSVAHSIERARRLLDRHAEALRMLPDPLREVIDRDLCVMHRRFVVSGRQQQRFIGPAVPPAVALDDVDADHSLHRHAFAGLALSGGGVRSASFSIGTLQTLGRLGLLRPMDFVSAVSGGSWAAGWMAAWAYRHKGGIGGVEDELKASLRAESAPLRWVRRHIAYLAPQPGIASGDTWGLLVAYMSNWLHILTLASLSLLALILLPHAISTSAAWIDRTPTWQGFATAVSGLFLLAQISVLRRLTLYYREPGSRRRDSKLISPVVCTLTLFATVSMAATFPMVFRGIGFPADGQPLAWHRSLGDSVHVLVPLIGLTLIFNAFGTVIAWLLQKGGGEKLVEGVHRAFSQRMTHSGKLKRHDTPLWKECVSVLLSAVLVALFGALVLPLTATLLPLPEQRITYGPIVVLAIFASAELFGVLVTRRRDVDRAWNARIGGWMLAAVTGWTLTCTLALSATSLLRDAYLWRGVISWLFLLMLGLAATVGFIYRRRYDWRNVLGLAVTTTMLPLLLLLTAAYLTRDAEGVLLQPFTLWFHLIAVTLLLWPIAWACNVNRFSLHSIYKQGLVRTFLGASRLALRNPTVAAPSSQHDTDDAQFRARRPAPPINIDEDDNLSLEAMVRDPARAVPVLLINAAVNGISRTDQEGRVPRQWPFTFSQRYSGSPADGIGYTNTHRFYANEGRDGLSLGGAMAVSSAAVSPTSGSSTRPLRAFLLGILNARLGMWIGNPHNPAAVKQTSPTLGGFTVLREMMGLRAKFGDWIHLSDGGHFENLGVYELVRRGCLRIIAIDASCDPKYEFDDLAELIRRARIDLDVQIYPRGNWCIHSPPVNGATAASTHTQQRGWMWFDIQYGAGLPCGRLLYIKPSVHDVQKLRPEVLNYSRQCAAFPHESTLNQFFTERQMEAYRSLGESNMDEALQAVMGDDGQRDEGLDILIGRSA